MKFPGPTVSANPSLRRRAGTGLYRKKSSSWNVAEACFFRRQKNQSNKMKTKSPILPPTVPPIMAPKPAVEGAVVAVGGGGGVELVGVLVDELEVEGVGVTEVMDTIGVLLANAP